jgi:hypothetical protein
LPKTLTCFYRIDLAGTASFSLDATAMLPALNVSFPVVSADVGGVAVDGTVAANQSNLAVTNQPISAWPPGAALWLGWEMSDPTGKAQGLAMDDLSFSASALPAGFVLPALTAPTASGTNFTFACASINGLAYQIEASDSLAPTNWVPLGSPLTGTGQPLTFTISATNVQRFFRVLISP